MQRKLLSSAFFFFSFPSCCEIQKLLCTEIQRAQIQNQLSQPLSWSSLQMMHSLWALCQITYNQKCAAKTAEPELPLLRWETSRPLRSIISKLISHVWMQCHPNAAGWISGPWASVPAGCMLDGRVWSWCYSRNHCTSETPLCSSPVTSATNILLRVYGNFSVWLIIWPQSLTKTPLCNMKQRGRTMIIVDRLELEEILKII